MVVIVSEYSDKEDDYNQPHHGEDEDINLHPSFYDSKYIRAVVDKAR